MEKSFAYSRLEVKEVNDDKRVISGWATTPEPDRDGDVIEPKGVKFRNPTTLLWMHNHSLPVGTVEFGTPTSKGVPFTASIKKTSSPSGLAARLDEAWESVKLGLVRDVSIGFRPLEWSIIEETGGYRFRSIELYELSLVTIPANTGATINQIKAFDAKIRASMGSKDDGVTKPSGHTEKSLKTVKIAKEGKTMNLAEKLKGFKNERAAKAAKMEEMMEKSLESGETFDAAAQEEYDNLQTEVKALDTHIEKAEQLIATKARTATAVTDKAGADEDKAKNVRAGVTIKNSENLEKGLLFARLARVKALAFTGQAGTRDEAQIAQMIYPQDDNLVKSLMEKAAVPAASTGSATWAGNLINDGGVAFADFVEYLRPRTLYGQVADRFRRLPFDTPVLVQGSGGVAQWVSEGEAKPLTQWTYTKTKLVPLKVAAIAAATKETLMRASVAADTLIRDELARSVGARIDGTLISADAAVSGESPAGLLNGTAALTLTGGDIQGIRCDIAAFLTAMVQANLTISGAFWVMPETVAIALSLATNEVGAPAFPGITPTGGTLAGLPVFTSQYMPVNTGGPVVALIKGDEIFLGDEGGIQVQVSDQASLQMDSAPTQNSVTPTASTVVSMFQTNSVAFLVERFLNWQKRRAQAVVWAEVDWDICTIS
jgi:HK97 family phage major capsid protein/HK97 family phage prohead protease